MTYQQEFKRDDRVKFGVFGPGTVVEVLGQLVYVKWDDRTYPYTDFNHPWEIDADVYLARQLTLLP